MTILQDVRFGMSIFLNGGDVALPFILIGNTVGFFILCHRNP